MPNCELNRWGCSFGFSTWIWLVWVVGVEKRKDPNTTISWESLRDGPGHTRSLLLWNVAVGRWKRSSSSSSSKRKPIWVVAVGPPGTTWQVGSCATAGGAKRETPACTFAAHSPMWIAPPPPPPPPPSTASYGLATPDRSRGGIWHSLTTNSFAFASFTCSTTVHNSCIFPFSFLFFFFQVGWKGNRYNFYLRQIKQTQKHTRAHWTRIKLQVLVVSVSWAKGLFEGAFSFFHNQNLL